jgi:hypothetical protein
VESDACDTGIAAILMQQQEDDKLFHPVAFITRTLSPAERNYEVYDREMLAIKYATKVWRPMLHSCASGFDVLTDNVSCKYFMTTKVLNQRQVRWAEQLADFNFRLIYRPRQKNDQADALSRRDNKGMVGDATYGLKKEPNRVFFQPHHLRRLTTVPYAADNLLKEIRQAQRADSQVSKLKESTGADDRYMVADGALLFKG